MNVTLIHNSISSYSGLHFHSVSLMPHILYYYRSLNTVKIWIWFVLLPTSPRALSSRWTIVKWDRWGRKKKKKLVVWDLSPAVTFYGVTHILTLGQYIVNKPSFDWQVTFHYREIIEALWKSKQTRHTLCHNQDTLQSGRTGQENFAAGLQTESPDLSVSFGLNLTTKPSCYYELTRLHTHFISWPWGSLSPPKECWHITLFCSDRVYMPW